MTDRAKSLIISGSGTVLSILWGAYSIVKAASDLPKDASEFAKMLADPPMYLPWLILAGSVLILAWSLWPGKISPAPSSSSEGQTGNIKQNHSGIGNNIVSR